MVGVVVTDLDGTLLNSERRLSTDSLRVLQRLGQLGVLRIVATGRSLFSARRVVPRDLPIDYVAFSSGAGIVDWGTQQLLCVHHLPGELVMAVASELVRLGWDFMLHEQIPNNHCFAYHRGGPHNADFEDRLALYSEFSRPLSLQTLGRPMSQVVAIEPPRRISKEKMLRQAFPELSVIRATSPLDGQSVWLEVFPFGVNKSSATRWLMTQRPPSCAGVLAVGNDYNDCDLLEFADYACVVDNAPIELKRRYTCVASNDAGGFAEAVARVVPECRGL